MRTPRTVTAVLAVVLATATATAIVTGCGQRPRPTGPPTNVAAATRADRVADSSTPSGRRTALVHHPTSAARGAALVVVLHGALGTGEQARNDYGWDALADRDGFVVAYPDGIGRAWNVGPSCCGQPHRRDVDDVGYLHQLLGELVVTDGVDTRRVYAVGISNGGMLAYSWACTRPGELAGIGPVAASLQTDCRRPAPITLAAVHGTADANVPVAGGVGPRGISGIDNPSLERTLALFRLADGCPGQAAVTAPPVRQRTWRCAGGRTVSSAVIDGAGHQWPGAPPLGPGARALGLDQPSTVLNATDWLWTHLRDARAG